MYCRHARIRRTLLLDGLKNMRGDVIHRYGARAAEFRGLLRNRIGCVARDIEGSALRSRSVDDNEDSIYTLVVARCKPRTTVRIGIK